MFTYHIFNDFKGQDSIYNEVPSMNIQVCVTTHQSRLNNEVHIYLLSNLVVGKDG